MVKQEGFKKKKRVEKKKILPLRRRAVDRDIFKLYM